MTQFGVNFLLQVIIHLKVSVQRNILIICHIGSCQHVEILSTLCYTIHALFIYLNYTKPIENVITFVYEVELIHRMMFVLSNLEVRYHVSVRIYLL